MNLTNNPETKTGNIHGMPWECPHCHKIAILCEEIVQKDYIQYTCWDESGRKDTRNVAMRVIVCPNLECHRESITLLRWSIHVGHNAPRLFKRIEPSVMMPAPAAGVPAQLYEDLKEAYAIIETSPRASATMARRCLQYLIRDFFKIIKGTLNDELKALQSDPRISSDLWDALDAVRKLGNIGAHPPKDISQIVDIEPHEAETILSVIDILIQESYVLSYERAQRLAKIQAIQPAKVQATLPAPVPAAPSVAQAVTPAPTVI